jgi:hypothetical protein
MKYSFAQVAAMGFASLVCAIVLFLIAHRADAKPQPDESDHDQVILYMYLPCEAMEVSHEFMTRQMLDNEKKYNICLVNSILSEFKWARLLCVYVQHDIDFKYTNIKSVEKAWEIMCDPVNGQRRNPMVEIKY